MAKSTRKKSQLESPSVFMRIRPTTDIGGHAQTGQPEAAKKLHGWTEDSVTIGWRCANATDMGQELAVGSGETHTYPKRVLGPEVTQEEVYRQTMPPLVDKLLGQNGCTPTDVMYFAYGQTGTGKSHTMLGTDNSLDAAAPADGACSPDWGLFPRAAYDIWRRLEVAGGEFMVTMTAAEFYLMAGNDLLMGNMPLAVSDDNKLVGLTEEVLDGPGDVLHHLRKARRRRHTRSTAMNVANVKDGQNDRHTGSSRGHAAFSLHVYQVVGEKKAVVKSSFNLVDLAGAERPDKIGVKRMSGIEAGMEIERCFKKNTEPSTAAQCMFINFELYCIGESVITATEGNKQNPTKGFRIKPLFSSACVRYLGNAFGGRAALAVIVTLSQAPACGWETWFSCRYGRDLSRLRAPCFPKQPFSVRDAIKDAHAEVAAQNAVLDTLSGKQRETRLAWLRVSLRTTAQQNLSVYRRLVGKYPALLGADAADPERFAKVFDMPKAVTMGYACVNGTMAPYPLTGTWSPASLTDFLNHEAAYSDVENFKLFLKLSLKDQRKLVDKAIADIVDNDANQAWVARHAAAIEPVTIDTTPYPPCDNAALKGFVYVPNGHEKGGEPLPVVVYCHGGAAVYCNPRLFDSIACRYAIENHVLVLSLQYRLAPDTKCPGMIYDCAGAVCYLHAHQSVAGYAIDPARIATHGDSGGALPALGGALELARRGEQDKIKLVVPNCPMISDILKKSKHRIEGHPRCLTEWTWQTSMLTPPNDPAFAPGGAKYWYIWLNNAPEALLGALPPLAFITSEFDYLRRAAEDVAQRVEKAGGSVVEFVVHPGHYHAWNGNMRHRDVAMYFDDFGKILAKHLL